MRIMPIVMGIAALIPPAALALSVDAAQGIELEPITFTIGAAFFLCCICYLIAAGMGEEKENQYGEAK